MSKKYKKHKSYLYGTKYPYIVRLIFRRIKMVIIKYISYIKH